MARCGCASDRCSCSINAGDGITVAGTGSRSNPYVVSAIPSTSGGGGTVSNRFSGEITAYGGTAAPAGWLLCDGTAVSRATYSALFGVIGTAFGAGDGSTTFNLPNMQDRFPVGAGGAHARGTSGGSRTITVANLPAHTHAIDHDHAAFNTGADGGHDHSANSNSADGTSSSVYRTAASSGLTTTRNLIQSDSEHVHSINVPPYAGASGSTGGGTDFDPPYVAVNYIVKT